MLFVASWVRMRKKGLKNILNSRSDPRGHKEDMDDDVEKLLRRQKPSENVRLYIE